jgi:hypothetical protein
MRNSGIFKISLVGVRACEHDCVGGPYVVATPVLTTFPRSRVACPDVLEPQPPGTLRTRNWPLQGLLYLLVCNIRRPISLLFTSATCFQTPSVCVLNQVLRPSQVMDLPESPRKMTIDFRQD